MNISKCISQDAIRLLYAIHLYTGGEDRPWLKQFVISVIAHTGVKRRVFTEYDLAPSLFSFRGVKMYAIVSQRACGDLDAFFRWGFIDKMLLNTRFHAQTNALRISAKGEELLGSQGIVTDEDRRLVDDLVRCRNCRALFDFAVSHEQQPYPRLIMNRVCSCATAGAHRKDDFWHDRHSSLIERIPTFFSIGDVEYRGKPFFLGRHDGP